MYLLTMVNFVNNREQTYVQLRDGDMRLMGVFHRKNLKQFVEDKNLTQLKQKIEQILLQAKPGKFYCIDTD